jgi:hypothetical protein
LAWAHSLGLPETFITITGREPFGCHFYFAGVRTLPNINQFELDGVVCDLISHGHVLVEGARHKTGAIYTAANDLPIAPLPDFLKNYELPKNKIQQIGQDNFEKALAEGSARLIPRGERHEFLLKEAGRLRWIGARREDIVAEMLRDICGTFCEDGENYAKRDDIASIAQYVCGQPCTRTVGPGGLKLTRAVPEVESVTLSLKELFTGGEQATIETIMGRIIDIHPGLGKTQLRRAMDRASFVKVGQDVDDSRKTLWSIQSKQLSLNTDPQRNNNHNNSISDSGLDRIVAEGAGLV